MKKFILLTCCFLTCFFSLHGVIDESNPWPIPPPPNFPAAPRSAEACALSPAMIAASVGVIAILVALALTSFNNHSHSSSGTNNGNS